MAWTFSYRLIVQRIGGPLNRGVGFLLPSYRLNVRLKTGSEKKFFSGLDFLISLLIKMPNFKFGQSGHLLFLLF